MKAFQNPKGHFYKELYTGIYHVYLHNCLNALTTISTEKGLFLSAFASQSNSSHTLLRPRLSLSSIYLFLL